MQTIRLNIMEGFTNGSKVAIFKEIFDQVRKV